MRPVPFIRDFDSAGAILPLLVIATAYAVIAFGVELALPFDVEAEFPPMEVALWLAIAVGFVVTLVRTAEFEPRTRAFGALLLAVLVIAAIAVLQTEDWTSGELLPSSGGDELEYIGNAALAVIIAAGLVVLSRFPQKNVWLSRALMASLVFQLLVLLQDYMESTLFFGSVSETRGFMLTGELAELLCIEFYVVAVALTGRRAVAAVFPATAVGAKAREFTRRYGLDQKHNHPPAAIAYVPVFRELTVGLAALWLVIAVGGGVRSATGKSKSRQFAEMIMLWFHDGIDPPSYYAQELYRTRNRAAAPEYLTRFETKNGLMSALNKMRASPYQVNEMGHKALFYKCCLEAGLPHPRVLASVENGKTAFLAPRDQLAADLFCKPQRGMGASGTLALRYVTPGQYIDEAGTVFDLDGAMAEAGRQAPDRQMLVQRWQKNHPDIADFARHSLVTFRVVTCLDEAGKPEVTLAMLRVLAKLEPDWPHALDEEYAAPMDLATGELGLFTGDDMNTSPLRYEHHPLTGVPVKGRIIRQWPEIRDLALKAHGVFAHRFLIGWDIALTPEGAKLLEGNTNLDVMFLQRVHDMPAGRTRMGALMSHQLDVLAARKDQAAARFASRLQGPAPLAAKYRNTKQ